jgi:Ni,Fe-hydrogenase I cytochrome b subunit
MKLINHLIGLFLIVLLIMSIYMAGYQQGSRAGFLEGEHYAISREGVLKYCTKWWFNGSESQTKFVINQYCKRTVK